MRNPNFPEFADCLDDPWNCVLTFFITISSKGFFADDLRMNAEPIRPHQGKELPSNLGLTQITLVAYILRLSQYSYSII